MNILHSKFGGEQFGSKFKSELTFEKCLLVECCRFLGRVVRGPRQKIDCGVFFFSYVYDYIQTNMRIILYKQKFNFCLVCKGRAI